jgi:hypothetical protein
MTSPYPTVVMEMVVINNASSSDAFSMAIYPMIPVRTTRWRAMKGCSNRRVDFFKKTDLSKISKWKGVIPMTL